GGFGASSRSAGGTHNLSFWYDPILMMTGKRPPPLGRNASALSRAPSRMGISRSFSITRSWRGCDPRWRRLVNGYSFLMLSSASDGGIVRPVAPAVLLLIANSNVAEDRPG